MDQLCKDRLKGLVAAVVLLSVFLLVSLGFFGWYVKKNKTTKLENARQRRREVDHEVEIELSKLRAPRPVPVPRQDMRRHPSWV